jgi:hypothetical protein
VLSRSAGEEMGATDICGPALIQPKVLPRAIGNEVPAPAVREFVGNDIDVRLITGYDSRSSKGDIGVLHAFASPLAIS